MSPNLLISKLAEIEKLMAHDWRRYQQYSEYYVFLKCQLETELANLARRARVLAQSKATKAFRLFEQITRQLTSRLRWFEYITYLKNERPIVYDWGVENSAVIEI